MDSRCISVVMCYYCFSDVSMFTFSDSMNDCRMMISGLPLPSCMTPVTRIEAVIATPYVEGL